ncbi:Fc.00g075650.m01.CDS01 [Cosmosporella sp. VM-42]
MRRRRKESASAANRDALTEYVRILSPSDDAPPRTEAKESMSTAESLLHPSTDALTDTPSLADTPSSSVFYLNYQFLSVGNLQNLLSGDIDYLELQGCFLVPRRDILDDIVQHFFLHVHPLLPLFNEADFWQMYGQRGAANASTPKTSLLVFQAFMFASCNFTSAKTIKTLGFSDIRQAKASFYRKAKLLFDFESESSPIYIAQAALLLSYRPSYATLGIKRPNTTWLTTAIQNAEIADANHYTSFQSSSPATPQEERKHQNTLKRLWWCCIIRDRVLPLCVRRNIQIDRARFNFAIDAPLRYADLEDEIEHSRVYDPKTKRHLIRILEKFVELCIILTDVLALVYPLDERRPSGSASVLDTSKIWQAKNALREWERDTASRLSDLADSTKKALNNSEDKGMPHESVTLYIHLMYMYYHSAWLALCHHEALGLANNTGQAYNSMSDLSLATSQNQQELFDAASAVTKSLERLNHLKLDRWLPSSAVACTAIPLVLHILDVKLSSLGPATQPLEPGSRIMQKHDRLKVLVDAMKTYHPQYDGVDFVVSAVRHIVDLVQLEGLQPAIGPATKDSFEWTDILSLNPSLYLRLALTIDLSLSKDRLAQEKDFPPSLRGMFGGDLSPIKALLAQGRGGWPNGNAQGADTDIVSDPSAISSTMEGWLKWDQILGLTAPTSEGSSSESKTGITGPTCAVGPARSASSPSDILKEGGALNSSASPDDLFHRGTSDEHTFDVAEFMGEVVGALSDREAASFVDDMIRAAL